MIHEHQDSVFCSVTHLYLPFLPLFLTLHSLLLSFFIHTSYYSISINTTTVFWWCLGLQILRRSQSRSQEKVQWGTFPYLRLRIGSGWSDPCLSSRREFMGNGKDTLKETIKFVNEWVNIRFRHWPSWFILKPTFITWHYETYVKQTNSDQYLSYLVDMKVSIRTYGKVNLHLHNWN